MGSMVEPVQAMKWSIYHHLTCYNRPIGGFHFKMNALVRAFVVWILLIIALCTCNTPPLSHHFQSLLFCSYTANYMHLDFNVVRCSGCECIDLLPAFSQKCHALCFPVFFYSDFCFWVKWWAIICHQNSFIYSLHKFYNVSTRLCHTL